MRRMTETACGGERSTLQRNIQTTLAFDLPRPRGDDLCSKAALVVDLRRFCCGVMLSAAMLGEIGITHRLERDPKIESVE